MSKMNMMDNKQISAPTSELEGKIAFLSYASDFLKQATQSSEKLKLPQVAYFLSMATIETNDHLVKLQVQCDSQRDVERAAKAS